MLWSQSGSGQGFTQPMPISDLCFHEDCLFWTLTLHHSLLLSHSVLAVSVLPAYSSATPLWIMWEYIYVCVYYIYIHIYIYWSTWTMDFAVLWWWVLENTVQCGESGGIGIGRPVSGSSSISSCGGVMAPCRLGDPMLAFNSGGCVTSALM